MIAQKIDFSCTAMHIKKCNLGIFEGQIFSKA